MAAAFEVSLDHLVQEAILGVGNAPPAKELRGSNLEYWTKEMTVLGPQLWPADRVTLLHAAQVMPQAQRQAAASEDCVYWTRMKPRWPIFPIGKRTNSSCTVTAG